MHVGNLSPEALARLRRLRDKAKAEVTERFTDLREYNVADEQYYEYAKAFLAAKEKELYWEKLLRRYT